MTRRPLCLVCMLLMFSMGLADLLGFPLVRGNPLPEEVQIWIEKHPESTICGEVERCTQGEFSVSVYLKNSYLIYNSEKVSIENTKVFLKKQELVPVGTVILVSGILSRVPGPRNPGEFDSRQYYACEHIYYFLKDAVIERKSGSYSAYGQFLQEMKGHFSEILTECAGETAPVFQSIVLGQKDNLEVETKLRYQMAGIVHILAISGLHISVLGMGLYHLLMKTGMGIWPSGLAALILILQYGMMTGSSVSAMRAVCMFLISVGAKISGRIYDMMTALAASAILILLESPAYLGSSAFLLSFGAVLGIGAVAPAWLRLSGVKGKAGKCLMSSLAVQMTTLPLSLYFYGEVSIAGIFLNLAVLPTVSIVLGSGVSAAILGNFCVPAGRASAIPGRILLEIYEKLCMLTAKLPFSAWTGGRPQLWQMLVYYLFLGMMLRMISKKSEGREYDRSAGNRSRRKIFPWFFMAAGVLILGYRPVGTLKITCLDVGQGDGITVETPEGFCFLIDGGSSSKTKVGQYQILPYLKSQGISRLDGILISHTDGDHISGVMEILEYIENNLISLRVDCLYLPEISNPPKEWRELADQAKKAQVRIQTVNRGDVICGGKMKLTVLSPKEGAGGENVNEDAMVLRLDYGAFGGLFTGDIGEKTEKILLEDNQLSDVDLLKVGHHGSRYSSSRAFLEKIRPELAIISCSEKNVYGHPSEETVERLELVGCRVEYTMESGAITVESDGEKTEITRFLA